MYELENVISNHLDDVQLPASTSINVYSGHVDGEDKYQSFLTGLNAAGFSFSTRTSLGASKSKGRIFFKKNASTKSQYEVSIAFFGSPFQVVKSVHLQCAQGEKYFKSKAFEAINEGLDVPPTKKQRCPKRSKKFGCPAFLSMKCIRVFDEPQYMLSVPNSHGISKVSERLQENLFKRSPMPTSFLRFLVVMSPAEAHTHPMTGPSVSQALHPRLREEIRSLVHDNITCVKAVKEDLCVVVKSMFDESGEPRPDPGNKCFYPTDKMIRNHIQMSQYEFKRSRFDERDLEKCVESWRNEYPDDSLFFRPGKDATNNRVGVDEASQSSTILFCHQTQWQRDLLGRYGNNISLLDPAYKTTKYPLPLFFIIVKTNCGYSIVGTFIVYDDTCTLVSEALAIFASWNPAWEPKYFLTDFSQAEINAVKENFPQSTIYLCVFHREQTWDRWLQQKSDRISSVDEQTVKKLWRDIATSISEEEYQANLVLMNTNETYKQCPLVKYYFTQKWLVCHERWVHAYHATEFLSTLNINNGMETQKKILKHSFLRFSSNKTASGILRIIVDEFLPQSLKDYCESNVKLNATLREFDKETSALLYDKTKTFVTHFKDESNKALRNYDIDKIIDMSAADSEGLFYVKSESEECYYIVDFQLATCSCSHFTKWQFPCKHMCALFMYTDWSFDKLPTKYRDSPYITVDSKYSPMVIEVGQRDWALKFDGVSMSKEQDERGSTSASNESGIEIRLSPPPHKSKIQTPLVSERQKPPANAADVLEAREKLKRILCYTYRMDATHPSTQEFCQQVNKLETETLQSLQRLEKVVAIPPVANTTNVRMPPLQLLRKKYTELPGWKKNAEVLRAVGRVVSVTNNGPRGLCYEIDMSAPMDDAQSDNEVDMTVPMDDSQADIKTDMSE